MKEMLAKMWHALGMTFTAWEDLMQIILNLTGTGKNMSKGLLNGSAHDAEVEALKLEEEIAVFKAQAAVRKQAALVAPAVTPAP